LKGATGLQLHGANIVVFFYIFCSDDADDAARRWEHDQIKKAASKSVRMTALRQSISFSVSWKQTCRRCSPHTEIFKGIILDHLFSIPAPHYDDEADDKALVKAQDALEYLRIAPSDIPGKDCLRSIEVGGKPFYLFANPNPINSARGDPSSDAHRGNGRLRFVAECKA
jgi:hypothetical protein